MNKLSLNKTSHLFAVVVFLLTNLALADGVKVITKCESLNQYGHQSQVAFTITKTVDYRLKTGAIQIDYKGSMNVDANPYTLEGTFKSSLPISDAPVPDLLQDFKVSYGSIIFTENLLLEKTKTPLNMKRVSFKVPTEGGGLFSAKQFAYLQFVTNPQINGPAVAALHLTNEAGDRALTPDRGAGLSLNCTSEVHDI